MIRKLFIGLLIFLTVTGHLFAKNTTVIKVGQSIISILTPTMFSVRPIGLKDLPATDLGVTNNKFAEVDFYVKHFKNGVFTITTDSIGRWGHSCCSSSFIQLLNKQLVG